MLASMVANQLYCLLDSRSSCDSTVLGSNDSPCRGGTAMLNV